MAISVTNRIAQPALRGDVPAVNLNATDQAQLPNITVGMRATLGSGAVGSVIRVDLFGNSFMVAPLLPSGNMASSSTPGILAVGETVSLT